MVINNHEFWLDKWQNNDIPFHLELPHPLLDRFWPLLQAKQKNTVLVPLCGKSQDIYWLSQKGLAVIGIELSPIAIKAFFDNNQLEFEKNPKGNFIYYQSQNITLICGDIFKLTKEDLGQIDYIYDRAALIALSSPLRKKYGQHLLNLAPQLKRMLLISNEYPQHLMQGPPFSVDQTMVKNYYGYRLSYKKIYQRTAVLTEKDSLFKRGLKELTHTVYLLSA
jgi:thiopurine S-methyltransferase